MTNKKNGLRFDLFERIILPQHMPAVAQLDEMELVPNIECLEENAMVIMRGYFKFSAEYTSTEFSSGATFQQIEHLIPVDITLPRQRIEKLEDAQVVIENYDVDQISERELNLNVVIELHGLTREEFELSSSAVSEDSNLEHSKLEPNLNDDWFADADDLQTVEENEESFEQEEQSIGVDDENVFYEEPATSLETSQHIAEQTSQQVAVAPLKEPLNEPKTNAKSVEANETDWTNRFFRPNDNHTSFRRMRMCIVQPADSLESIANRYGIHAQELVVFNRLTERQIQAGQIIYLP